MSARDEVSRGSLRARPGQPRLARPDHDPQGTAPAAKPAPPAGPPAHHAGGDHRGRHSRPVTSPRSLRPEPFTPLLGRHRVADPLTARAGDRRVPGLVLAARLHESFDDLTPAEFESPHAERGARSTRTTKI